MSFPFIELGLSCLVFATFVYLFPDPLSADKPYQSCRRGAYIHSPIVSSCFQAHLFQIANPQWYPGSSSAYLDRL